MVDSVPDQLEKATLTIVPASANPRPGPGKTLNFQFNPQSYTVSKSATWSRSDAQCAQEAGPIQWQGAGPKQMSLQIFLDRSDAANASVIDDVNTLFACCTPTATSKASEKPSGPYVLFGWGKNLSFWAVVTSVSVEYLMFWPNGDPYRARASLSLEQVDAPTPKQNPTSGGLPARRTHTLLEGETLAHVAQSEYGDPGAWRVLAEANGIDDPMRVRSGDRLLVPSPAEALGAPGTPGTPRPAEPEPAGI